VANTSADIEEVGNLLLTHKIANDAVIFSVFSCWSRGSMIEEDRMHLWIKYLLAAHPLENAHNGGGVIV